MQNLEIDIDLMQPVVTVAEPKVYKRDIYVSKEIYICIERDIYVWKEIYKIDNVEIDIDLMQPVVTVAQPKVWKRDQYVSKETNMQNLEIECQSRHIRDAIFCQLHYLYLNVGCALWIYWHA